MILKLLSIAVVALPIVLAFRAVFQSRGRQSNPRMQQFKREVDFAISLFIFLVVCAALYALLQIMWTR